MDLLKGKKILILGIANERSIATSIAKRFSQHGASIGFTYQTERSKQFAEEFSNSINSDFFMEFDVRNDEHYIALNEKIQKIWGKFDGIIHSLAYANTQCFKDKFINTTRENFIEACDISAFSLVYLAHRFHNLLNEESSIIAMTYEGSQKIIPPYNVMGVAKAALEASIRYLAYDLGESKIRVNAISAGPVRTLAASAISGFKKSLSIVEESSPLKRNITSDDVADTALYLVSNLSKNITAQILYVDSGISKMGAGL